MSDDRDDTGPHLDVLVEDEFSRFVADDLSPDVVVGAFKDRINVGIDSRDGTVDVYLGNLSPASARAFAALLEEAADAVESDSADDGRTWVLADTEE
ncbi:MAG: hypothetical protein ABEJ76_00225 [Halanaeroarchaeum sp.]